MRIEDLIVETKKVKWRELEDLQPENLKKGFNSNKTKKSIIEMGFAQAIYVWQNPENNVIRIVDGHMRKSLLKELVNDGVEVPEELSCTFLDNTKIKTEKEAIQYLLRVFNIKTNPLDLITLEDWLEDADLNFQEVAFDDLNIKMEDADFNNLEIENEKVNFDNSNIEVEEVKAQDIKEDRNNSIDFNNAPYGKKYLQIECESEAEQEILYNRFLQEGLKVKIISL